MLVDLVLKKFTVFTSFITFLGILKGDSFEESLDIFSLLFVLNDSPGMYFSISFIEGFTMSLRLKLTINFYFQNKIILTT